MPLWLGGVLAAAAGGAYLFFGTEGTAHDTAKEIGSTAKGVAQAVERKTGFAHSKEDYQKVYDAIAAELEKEGHDGKCRLCMVEQQCPLCSGNRCAGETGNSCRVPEHSDLVLTQTSPGQ